MKIDLNKLTVQSLEDSIKETTKTEIKLRARTSFLLPKIIEFQEHGYTLKQIHTYFINEKLITARYDTFCRMVKKLKNAQADRLSHVQSAPLSAQASPTEEDIAKLIGK